MTTLPLAVVHAGTCMFVMHVYSTTSFCFLFWKVLKESFAIFMKHKKTHFNKYAFTNAIGLRRGYTIAFPSIFNLFMRIHKCVLFFLWKHIPNIYIFHRHVIAGGNTFLIHSSLQSLFGLYVGKHITYLCIIYIHSGNTRAHLCFYWLMKRRHMRVPLFSGLSIGYTHAFPDAASLIPPR